MLTLEVVSTGNAVTRETLDKNSLLVSVAIEELGTRVSVPTCEWHIRSFYEYATIPVPGLGVMLGGCRHACQFLFIMCLRSMLKKISAR